MRGDIPLKKLNKTIKVNSANKILKDKIKKKTKKKLGLTRLIRDFGYKIRIIS
jgi:hypothetical protein